MHRCVLNLDISLFLFRMKVAFHQIREGPETRRMWRVISTHTLPNLDSVEASDITLPMSLSLWSAV